MTPSDRTLDFGWEYYVDESRGDFSDTRFYLTEFHHWRIENRIHPTGHAGLSLRWFHVCDGSTNVPAGPHVSGRIRLKWFVAANHTAATETFVAFELKT